MMSIAVIAGKRRLSYIKWIMAAVCLLLAGSGCQAQESRPFRAIVASDLHYTSSEHAVDVIVSGMAFADEITDALVEEVIAEAPDVFIMTGDNTNSGARADALILVEKLSRIREAGIDVVITTGNHDMWVKDPTVFEDCYWPLFTPDERDEASSSYVQVVNGVALFAMDDNAVTMGAEGKFSQNTMAWLQEMLEKYSPQYPIVFLSHHNVLVGLGQEQTESYRIQNDELPGLLKEYGVHLILTGHLHSQMLEEWDGLYEVVNAMPFGGEHAIGRLEITLEPDEGDSVGPDHDGTDDESTGSEGSDSGAAGSEDPDSGAAGSGSSDSGAADSVGLVSEAAGETKENGASGKAVQVHYAIEPMNIARYGREGLAQELTLKDQERSERFREWFYQILAQTGCPEAEQEMAADLMEAFFRYYEEGTLADHRGEILSNAVYQVMIDSLWDSNYGPWMKSTIENVSRNAGSVEFSYVLGEQD